MIETVVIATDGSESVGRAVDVALDVAARFDASVHAISVVDEDEIDASPAAVRDDLRAALVERSEAALRSVADRTTREVQTAIRTGRPVAEIDAYARRHGADVVAVGTRGRHGEHRLLMGSVAEALVRTCSVPVLTVRQLEG